MGDQILIKARRQRIESTVQMFPPRSDSTMHCNIKLREDWQDAALGSQHPYRKLVEEFAPSIWNL